METMRSNEEMLEYQNDSFEDVQTYDASICIMTKILSLMSGRWKPIILYLIRNNVNRFGLLQKKMPSISKKVLAEQLRELERDNLITREIVEAKHPQVVFYHLTEKGQSLRKLIDEMVNWGLLNLRAEHTLMYSHPDSFRQ